MEVRDRRSALPVRLLILSSSTGGGHDARAGALTQWAERHPELGIEVETYAPLEASGPHYRFGLHLYHVVQTRWPGAHHLYFAFLEHASLHSRRWKLLGTRPYVEKLLDYRPDWVLSVHPHLNRGFLELAREVLGHRRVRIGTCCTELDGGYGFSRHWVNPASDAWIGATAPACAQARALGMPAERTLRGGFVLRPDFERPPIGAAERAAFLHDAFGLDAERPVVLLATGAAGANNHLAFLDALDRAAPALQVLALCARRSGLLEGLRGWRPRRGAIALSAVPYTQEMPRLLRSVDVLVSRGGSCTTSEAIRSGCPLLVNALGGVMPQEGVTLRYLERFGLGRRVRRAADLPPALAGMLSAGEAARQRTQMAQARPPGDARQILEYLLARAP